MSPARLLCVLLLAGALGCALATNIHVVNKCGFDTDVIYTANVNEHPLPSRNLGTLRPGYPPYAPFLNIKRIIEEKKI